MTTRLYRCLCSGRNAQKRSFFSFGNNDDRLVEDSGMYKFSESRVLKYDQKSLFNVIADVDAYKEFLPFCSLSRVLKCQNAQTREPQRLTEKPWLSANNSDSWLLEAEVAAGALGFEARYTSIVTVQKWGRIHARAKDSAVFNHLDTLWSLKSVSNNETRVDLTIHYMFQSPLLAIAANSAWHQVNCAMLDQFSDRAAQISLR